MIKALGLGKRYGRRRVFREADLGQAAGARGGMAKRLWENHPPQNLHIANRAGRGKLLLGHRREEAAKMFKDAASSPTKSQWY